MIGDKIRQRRLELNLTQANLSNMTNIKKNTISNYENNISSPSEENLFNLMKALKCDANYLFEDFLKLEENLEITSAEKEYIKKYRTLDEYGQKTVDSALDIQYERCIADQESKTITPEKTYPVQLIAHDGINRKTDVSEQNLINAIKADREIQQKKHKK